MGKMKTLEEQIETYTDAPFKIQREYCRCIFEILQSGDRDYLLEKARGNLKVAMNMALGDLND